MAIQKKIVSGMATLIILHEEMDVIMKIIKSLKKWDSLNLLTKAVSETIKNEVK